MGSGIKFHIAYPRPFWREAGLSGQYLADDGGARITFDASAAPEGPGILAGFIGAASTSDTAILAARAEQRALVVPGLYSAEPVLPAGTSAARRPHHGSAPCQRLERQGHTGVADPKHAASQPVQADNRAKGKRKCHGTGFRWLMVALACCGPATKVFSGASPGRNRPAPPVPAAAGRGPA